MVGGDYKPIYSGSVRVFSLIFVARFFSAWLSSVCVTFRLAVLRAARFGREWLITGYNSGLRRPSPQT